MDESRLRRLLPHIPSIIGFATFWGICYVISSVSLSATHLILAITALVVVYGATALWYILSVVECFETDGGVKYRSNRLISFYFMRLSFDAASDVFGLCCV
jgi:hypothetical protein